MSQQEEQKDQEKQEIIRQQQEAEQYLNMFTEQNVTTPQTSISIRENLSDEEMIAVNEEIIQACDDFMLERVQGKDSSLRISDLTALKRAAFEQNQLLKNRATANINLNVNDLQGKSPQELLTLLDSL